MTVYLFCYDGSQDSAAALEFAGPLLSRGHGKPALAVVLTVWETVEMQLVRAGASSGGGLRDLAQLDRDEARRARYVAERPLPWVTALGYRPAARTEMATASVARSILDVADDIGADLIVCGRRRRSRLAQAVSPSVSRYLTSHAGRPVLVAPAPTSSRSGGRKHLTPRALLVSKVRTLRSLTPYAAAS